MSLLLRNTLLVLLAASAPGLVAGSDATPVHQDHHATGSGEVDLGHAGHDGLDDALPARRWTPDAPLSHGMQRVRAATQALEHGSHDHLDDGQVRTIAAELKSAVAMMFAQCKLEPEPDAALHPLLARVLAASNTLAQSGYDAAALAELQAVLARYPLVFDDPAWRASQSD